MFGCWLGCSGAIAGVVEVIGFSDVVGFLDDMLSALFLVGDCSCEVSSCGLTSRGIPGGMEVSGMEGNNKGRRM